MNRERMNRQPRPSSRLQAALVACMLGLTFGCGGPDGGAPDEPEAAAPFAVDRLALPPVPAPEDNPITAGKVELGRQLFFDRRLSPDASMACESCHLPERGWTDGLPLSTRFDGQVNTRHTPTLYNVAYYREWYWDGRMATLEAQILAAWRGQMGGEPDAVAGLLNGIPAYRAQFEAHFGEPATPENITQALATFVRTLVADQSPWDRYEIGGDEDAVSEEAKAGFDVFSEKANCTLCHLPPLYSDTLYHNVGIGFDEPDPDAGRGAILLDSLGPDDPEAVRHIGAFKTPTLREITETGPYFHDGSVATLEEAVDLMLAGGIPNPYMDEKLKPKTITAEERGQLLAFLRSLRSDPPDTERPALP